MAAVNSPPEALIVFARNPQPGKAKTRLIPALGAEGAVRLYQQMAEQTLRRARRVAQQRSLQLAIHFAGDSLPSMQTWLGADLDYQPQGSGDLGDRMSAALRSAFQQGATSVVIIGTDCPDLSTTILTEAFDRLHSHNLVLGPAQDGGYYLIGLRRWVPELFQGIAWSSDRVYAQTRAIAQHQRLTVAELPTLADVDQPEDLIVWKHATASISMIIPTLNEADNLAKTFAAIAQSDYAASIETIVVDGGSQDATVEIAHDHGAIVLSSAPGRAHQMNRGARHAKGDILLFLHGDTQLPIDFDWWIRQTLQQDSCPVAGAFELAIDHPARALRWIEWGVQWRSRRCQMPYGDQAIFMRREIFEQVGGFPEQPIMEDFELMRRLQRFRKVGRKVGRLGSVAIVPVAVRTSSRRWQRVGIWRTTWLNQWIILAYFLGISPERIAQWYRGQRKN